MRFFSFQKIPKKFTVSKIVVRYINDFSYPPGTQLSDMEIEDEDFESSMTVHVTADKNEYGLYLVDVRSISNLSKSISQDSTFFVNALILKKFDKKPIDELIHHYINFSQKTPKYSWVEFDNSISRQFNPVFHDPAYLPDPHAPKGYKPWRNKFT